MSEKKGFFGKLFGRGKENPAPPPPAGGAPVEEATDVGNLPAETLAAKIGAPEIGAPETAQPAPIVEPAAEPVPIPPPQQGQDRPASIESGLQEPSALESSPEPEPVSAPLSTAAAAIDTAPETNEPKRGFFARLTEGLSRTSARLSEGVSGIFSSKKLDDDTLEELEDLLISADLGLGATARITKKLAADKFDKQVSETEVRQAVADEIYDTLLDLERPVAFNTPHKPHVILMTGVNGAGKTTTIGKMAQKYANDGKTVMLAAGDTFRAAAIEQLTVWGDRVGAPVITRGVGADAAALAFDAYQEAKQQNIDILMIDTAGRLQNRKELMDELAKVVRVIRKVDESAPHDTILVLDATVGQNALSQTEVFMDIAGVSGLVMTKLDGTARGGVLVALADKFALPIHFIGIGESVADLQRFDAYNFSHALVGLDKDT